MPQWLQHEFFHHLFGLYPLAALEASSHQWFDRRTWPADFRGYLEADYYAEALEKRLRSAQPPLCISLRAAPPARQLLERLAPEMARGRYRRDPVENDWHQGVIDWDRSGGAPATLLRWTNAAGRSWTLSPDFGNAILRFGGDSPYREADHHSRAFRIALRRNADGDHVPEVAGYYFHGDFYRRLAEP